jgi:parallel beta-helix repeat protein
MINHPIRHWLVFPALLLFAVLVLSAPANAQPTCGQTIMQNTKLESDLICRSSEADPSPDGLVIGAPGITLNLNGHAVYAYHWGIRNDGFDDVVIRDGTLGGEYEAVHLVDAKRNTLRNLELGSLQFAVTGIDVDGLSLIGATTHFTVSVSGDGIVVRDNATSGYLASLRVVGDGNRIVRNTSSGVDNGIFVTGDHNRIVRNSLTPWFFAGIWVAGGKGNLVEHNSITGRSDRACGMVLDDVRGTLVRGNLVTGHQNGIWLRSGDGNAFVRNRVANATTDDGTCQMYDTMQTPQDGLRVEAAATNTVLWGNSASNMPDDGIDTDAAGTHLRRNTATNNGDLGIEAVPSVSDLGGNRASGNGNPLQCLNVFCSP